MSKKKEKKIEKSKSTTVKKRKSRLSSEIRIKEYEPTTVTEELTKITNAKSIEQIKRPKKIAFMICFYSIIFLAMVVFVLIKFSRPKKTEIKDISYFRDETIEISENFTEKMVETSIDDKPTEKIVETSVDDKPTEKIIESIKENETTKKVEESAENVAKKAKKETESYIVETVKAKPYNLDEFKKKKTSINTLLPKYENVLYSFSMFYQYDLDEVGVIFKNLEKSYSNIKDNIFGNNVPFESKGANGIVYLNYMNLKDYMILYKDAFRKAYESLPIAPYLSYVTDGNFKFDPTTYTNNLSVSLEFNNAKDDGMYYIIPATFYEPAKANLSPQGKKSVNLRVLKKSMVGFSESFALTAMLEILDIECNTKNNPYFPIEDAIGENPKANTYFQNSAFKIGEMLKTTKFNYVIYDKKGYVTGLFMIK